MPMSMSMNSLYEAFGAQLTISWHILLIYCLNSHSGHVITYFFNPLLAVGPQNSISMNLTYLYEAFLIVCIVLTFDLTRLRADASLVVTQMSTRL